MAIQKTGSGERGCELIIRKQPDTLSRVRHIVAVDESRIFVDERRVAAVEHAIASGLGLDEAVDGTGLTARVCWLIAVRLSRPNALRLRQPADPPPCHRDGHLHTALTDALERLRRLASAKASGLLDGVLDIVVALEDAIQAEGGAS